METILDCKQGCDFETKCSFFHWQHSRKKCTYYTHLKDEILELTTDSDSLIGVLYCHNNLILWKNTKLISLRTTATPTSTTQTARLQDSDTTCVKYLDYNPLCLWNRGA